MIGLLKAVFEARYLIVENAKRYGLIRKWETRFQCGIDKRALLNIENHEKFRVGTGTTIGAFTVITLADYAQEKMAELTIGKNTYIGEQNNIRAAGGKITIGDNCLISQNVQIIAANHQYLPGINIADQPWSQQNNFVHIGSDVWLGCGVIVLPGVTIGNGAVVAAGSVVSKSLPENSISMGTPARVHKFR